jgi:hypothetical protein
MRPRYKQGCKLQCQILTYFFGAIDITLDVVLWWQELTLTPRQVGLAPRVCYTISYLWE